MEEKEGDVLEGQLSFLLTYIFFPPVCMWAMERKEEGIDSL